MLRLLRIKFGTFLHWTSNVEIIIPPTKKKHTKSLRTRSEWSLQSAPIGLQPSEARSQRHRCRKKSSHSPGAVTTGRRAITNNGLVPGCITGVEKKYWLLSFLIDCILSLEILKFKIFEYTDSLRAKNTKPPSSIWIDPEESKQINSIAINRILPVLKDFFELDPRSHSRQRRLCGCSTVAGRQWHQLTRYVAHGL